MKRDLYQNCRRILYVNTSEERILSIYLEGRYFREYLPPANVRTRNFYSYRLMLIMMMMIMMMMVLVMRIDDVDNDVYDDDHHQHTKRKNMIVRTKRL